MERVYEYRVHIKKMRDIIPAFLIIIAFLQAIALLIFTGFDLTALVIASILAVVLVLEAVFIRIFYGRFVRVHCSLTEAGIVYTNIKGTITIPYDEITEVEFPSIKYFGGWVKIKSLNDTIRLTVVIENIQDFVIDLKKKIDDREITPKLNEKNYRAFVRTATYSDHSWQRVYKIWLKLLGITVLTTVLSIVVYKIGNLNTPEIIWVGLLSYSLPTIVYVVCEIVLGKWISKQFKAAEGSENDLDIDRDTNYEKAVYSKGMKYGSVSYVVMLVLFILIA